MHEYIYHYCFLIVAFACSSFLIPTYTLEKQSMMNKLLSLLRPQATDHLAAMATHCRRQWVSPQQPITLLT